MCDEKGSGMKNQRLDIRYPIVYNTQMTENGPSRQISPEIAKLDSVVQLLSTAGYYYQEQETHEDPNGYMHFKRYLTDNFNPHFHITYKTEAQKIKLRLNKNSEPTSRIKTSFSQERYRLYEMFTFWSLSQNQAIAKIAEKLREQMWETHPSNTAKLLNNGTFPKEQIKTKQKKTKKQAARKESKHRKAKWEIAHAKTKLKKVPGIIDGTHILQADDIPSRQK